MPDRRVREGAALSAEDEAGGLRYKAGSTGRRPPEQRLSYFVQTVAEKTAKELVMGLKSSVIAMARRLLPNWLKLKLFNFSAAAAPEAARAHAFHNLRAPDMELGLRAAVERGLVCESVLDIGAFEGEWTRMARRIWPDARLAMIEANTGKKPRLDQVAATTGAALHMHLLSATDGEELTFHVMESGSSVLEETSPLARATQTIKARTLDALFPDQSFDLIKIDVQGYELEVMKGGAALLERASAVLMEIALIEVNRGAPLIDEVLAFMRARGFVSYEVLEIHRRPLDKAMNQIDILFVRETSPLLRDKSHF